MTSLQKKIAVAVALLFALAFFFLCGEDRLLYTLCFIVLQLLTFGCCRSKNLVAFAVSFVPSVILFALHLTGNDTGWWIAAPVLCSVLICLLSALPVSRPRTTTNWWLFSMIVAVLAAFIVAAWKMWRV